MSSQAVLWKHMMDAMVPVPTGGLLGLRRAWLAARGVLGANCLRRIHHPCRDLWSVMSLPLAWDGGGMGVGRRAANSQRLHCHRTKETLRPESSADPSETGPAAGSPPPWPGGQTGGLLCGSPGGRSGGLCWESLAKVLSERQAL